MNKIDLSQVAYQNKKYLTSAKSFFEKHSSKMIAVNHYHHNMEPNYWQYMLKDIYENQNSFQNKSCLEYGCGAGRNLVNMAILGGFSRVDGIDISKSNAFNAQSFLRQKLGDLGVNSVCIEGDGFTCLPFSNNSYDFVMSHQVFIHIPNYEVRASIIRDIKRILKEGGVFICHFKTIDDSVGYFENYQKFPKNVLPESKEQIATDFKQFGFKSVDVIEALNFVDGKPEWFIRCVK
jgi:SAM-dependent methyltransferase